MAQMNTRFIPDAALVAIRALFDNAIFEQNQNLYYKELGFRDYDPDAQDEQGNAISGPQKGVLTVEGQEYGDNSIYRGYPVQVNLRKYTSKLVVTEEQMHWLSKGKNAKKIDEISSLVKDNVNALNGNVNLDGCKMFYLGFGTTFFTGGDTLALFSSVHTIRTSATTYNNTYATGDYHRVFNETNIIDALNIMDRFVGMNGEEFQRCKHIRVICSKELAPTVWRALKSTYGPNTANLGLNTAAEEALKSRGVTIDYFVAEDIPYAYRNYWFLIDLDRAQKMFLMDWGWKPRLNDQWEYRDGTFFNLGSVYFGPRALSWQFCFGSKGDGSVI